MKKVFVIFLALIIGLSMSAQIQNKFLGFTLGSSTKSQVYNKYKNEKVFSVDEIGNIYVGDLVFAGQKWDITTFYFYHNKLESIQFCDIETSTPRYLMQSIWKGLKTSLWDKYSDYFIENSQSEFIHYSDGITDLVLSYLNYSPDEKGLALRYYNHALRVIRMQAEEDDL